MVGVPNSKGCEACKKQKKGCVGTSAPCQRCKRLGIECRGLGELRFTFRDESARTAGRAKRIQQTKSREQSPNSTAIVTYEGNDSIEDFFVNPLVESQQELQRKLNALPKKMIRATILQQKLPGLRAFPTNHLTNVINAFTTSIDPTIASGIQLLWNFGPFLMDVPSKIGNNPALDASVEALVAAYARFKARRTMALIPAKHSGFESYSNALQALRKALSDPATAQTSETLASTMIMLMVEFLNGPGEGRLLSHAGGAAAILRARKHQSPRNPFEARIMLSLRGPVIMQALSSSKPLFNSNEWADIAHNTNDEKTADGRMMHVMAQLPNQVTRVRDAWSAPTVDHGALLAITEELMTLREEIMACRIEIADRFEKQDNLQPHPSMLPVEECVMHSHYLRQINIAYTTEMLLNMILSGAAAHTKPSSASTNRPVVIDEYLLMADACARETLRLADKAEYHRPLGTAYHGFALRVARAASLTEDQEQALLGRLHQFIDDIGADSDWLSPGELKEMRDWLTARDLRARSSMELVSGRGTDKGYMMF